MENNSGIRRDKQIAASLHDGPAQLLYAVQLKINKLKKSSDIRLIKKEIAAVEKMVDMSIAQTKKVILQLAPPKVVGGKFVDEIRYYLEKLKGLKNIKYDFEADIPEFFTFDFGNEMMRIFLEAVNNVQKHSRAKKIKVVFKAHKKNIELSVEDDGIGFRPVEKNFKYGIKSMLSNAGEINAHIRIKSVPGKGTLVKLDVPRDIPGK